MDYQKLGKSIIYPSPWWSQLAVCHTQPQKGLVYIETQQAAEYSVGPTPSARTLW